MIHVKDGQKLQLSKKILRTYAMFLDELRLKLYETADAADISEETGWHILFKELSMRKLWAR